MTEQLYSEVFGQGENLTLLHGYPLDHRIWMDIVPFMEGKCRLLMPDLRGHGQSLAPKGPYTMKAMAEDVIGLLDAHEIGQTYIAGHSMGGYVALALARYFPDRLLGLALTASHAYADSPENKQARIVSISQIEKEGITPLLSSVPDKLSYNKRVAEKCRKIISDANRDGAMGVLAAMAERPDSIELLADLQMPILIVAGKDDQIIPNETSWKMAGKLRVGRIVEISSAGHMPMLDQSELTAAALLSLINFG